MTRPVPALRSSYSAFIPLSLRWNDVDKYGHVNNAVHFQLFDTAVNNWLMDHKLFQSDSGPICLVVRQACDFFREIQMNDHVTIGIGIKQVGTSSIVYAPALFTNEDASAAAQGEYIHVAIDRITRRPCPIDAATQAVLTRHLMNTSDQSSFS